MTTITENTTIKKAEEVLEATEVTKVDELEERLKSYKIRLDSMYNKNEELQNKLKIVKEDNLSVVIPREYIKGLVEAVVEGRKVEMIERMNEAEEMLERLHADDIQEALKDLLELKNLKARVQDVEYDLDDKLSMNDVENEIDNALDYKDYCTSSDVDELIADKINPDNYITTSEHNQEYRELESRINDLTSIIENKQKQVNMFKRLYNKIKALFSYSFKSKVGVK